jgi:hypothetical protein
MPFIPNPFKSKTSNIKSGLLNRPASGGALCQILGEPAAKQVIALVVDHHMAAAIALDRSYAQLFELGDAVIGLELTNIYSSLFRLGGLALRLNLHNMANQLTAGNVLAEATYNALVGDSPATKAAKWLVHSSNTLADAQVSAIRDTLIALNNQPVALNTLAGLAQINYMVNIGGGIAPQYRGIAVNGGRIVCSASGTRLLELSMQQTAGVVPGVGGITWADYALYLLATVVRAHGFTDGNGRTARAAYALAMLRGGVAFRAPTNQFETSLHGL